MKNIRFPVFLRTSFLVLFSLMGATSMLQAQAPTSLSYPTPNVFIANETNVYLAPSLAGNVSSYSITPALPAGLSFNTSTGVITGIPTAASAAASYTVTATSTSPAGSTSFALSIQVTNNYFNNAYSNVNFGGAGVTITNIIGNGTAAGNIVLYQNVATLSGQSIDAVVRTTALATGTFIAFDTAATNGASFSNNQARFFSPQFNFTGAGSATFDFQFILGGSYNTTTNTGTPVVLQNVKLNTYDIDGNTQANSNQYNEFGGFDSSETGSFSTIGTSYDAATGLTKFLSNTTANYTNVLSDTTRARLSYHNLGDFTIKVGAGSAGQCFFFLDFGAGQTFSTAVAVAAPSIDLNTSIVGVNNAVSGCGSSLAFTGSSQTNASSGGALNSLIINFQTTDITDGASEQLLINGATSGATIALNFANAATITNVALGGVTYAVAAAVTGNVSTLTFSNSAGGTFTLAQAETLLDALRYNNAATTPTSGNRNFTVNLMNTSFKSPDAVFTASLNCVSVGGKVYHDANGLSDNIINANGNQFGANVVYVVRVNPANNQVIDSKGIASGGTYSFGTVTAGNYALYLSNSAPAAGSTFTAATYPTGGIASIGENLGAGAGNDLLVDGKMLVTIGSSGTSDANFGVEIAPVTSNSTLSSIPNPGGFNNYTIASSNFNAADPDGTISSITITEFPTGANYLKIGSTIYTNPSGGSCPPLSTCTTWPGTVTIPYSSGAPAQTISVDPAADVTSSVVIKFTALDNAGLVSNAGIYSTLTVQFAVTNFYSVAGNVWNDFNGNGIKESAEAYTAAAGTGQTLYALLVQTTNTYSGVPTVFSSAAVSSTSGYTFSNVPAGNNYAVRIASLSAAPATGSAASAITPQLGAGWTAVSTVNGGTVTTSLNTNNPSIAITNLAAAQTNMSFGIEQPATSDAKTYTNVNPSTGGPATIVSLLNTNNSAVRYVRSLNMTGTASSGSIPGTLTGTDLDGGTGGTSLALGSGTSGVSLVIDPSLYTNSQATTAPTMLAYNGVQLQSGGCKGSDAGNAFCSNYNSTSGYWEIPNYDGTLLKVLATGGTLQLGFGYAWKDASGTTGNFATYGVAFAQSLPLKLVSFTAKAGAGNTAVLQWNTANEYNTDRFDIERSQDGATFTKTGTVKAAGQAGSHSYSFTDPGAAAGSSYYRLAMVDLDGSVAYSATVVVKTAAPESSVAVFPNPAKNTAEVTISWKQATAGKAAITIYQNTGTKVYTGKLDASGKAVIPVRNWPSGVYYFTIDNGKQKQYGKLLVD